MTHENSDYIAALRAKGYRVTPQRLIVLDAVCDLKGHATIADIQAKVIDMDPTIDRSTIYRALDVLVEVGLVVESELGETGKVYRIAGEAEHHHLICQSCGAVLTIDSEIFTPLLAQIQADYGFVIRADHLILNGLCKSCADKIANS